MPLRSPARGLRLAPALAAWRSLQVHRPSGEGLASRPKTLAQPLENAREGSRLHPRATDLSLPTSQNPSSGAQPSFPDGWPPDGPQEKETAVAKKKARAQRETSKRGHAKLRLLTEEEHEITLTRIPLFAWDVLDTIHRAGHEAYLVGGCVRDMCVGQLPKDFDILSTAEPQQVKRLFPRRAMIVGRRYRICHVRSTGGAIVEVSSFGTEVVPSPVDKAATMPAAGPGLRDEPMAAAGSASEQAELRPPPEWTERDIARWENARKRDFTINGLLYDPFRELLYDYVGALKDLKQRKVRTILPPGESFCEDPARILRAIRIAGRLGFQFEAATGKALSEGSVPAVVASINKSRLMLEMQAMLAYGAAQHTVRLLWRYDLLQVLLPFQARYLRRSKLAKRSRKQTFLLDLMRSLDRMVSPDQPCEMALWVALLAAQLAIEEQEARPAVIAAMALAVHGQQGYPDAAARALRIHKRKVAESEAAEEAPGQERQEASGRVGAARRRHRAGQLEPEERPAADIWQEAEELGSRAKRWADELVDPRVVGRLVEEEAGIPAQDLVVVSKAAWADARKLFERISRPAKRHKDAPYSLEEDRRFMFSRVILNTLYAPRSQQVAVASKLDVRQHQQIAVPSKVDLRL